MELLRSKMQVQVPGSGRRLYTGYVDCVRSLVASDGVTSLYRGNASMALRDGPAFGVYFATCAILPHLHRTAVARHSVSLRLARSAHCERAAVCTQLVCPRTVRRGGALLPRGVCRLSAAAATRA